MTAEDRIRIGGLMRCCIKTIREDERQPEEGSRLPCRWCSSTSRFRDGAWEWESPFEGASE